MSRAALALALVLAWPAAGDETAQAFILSWEPATERANGDPLTPDEIDAHRIRCGGDDVAIVMMPTTTFDARVVGYGERECIARTIDSEGLESDDSNTVLMRYFPARVRAPQAPTARVLAVRPAQSTPAVAHVTAGNTAGAEASRVDVQHAHPGGDVYVWVGTRYGPVEPAASFGGQSMQHVGTVIAAGDGDVRVDLFRSPAVVSGTVLGRVDLSPARRASVLWVSVAGGGAPRPAVSATRPNRTDAGTRLAVEIPAAAGDLLLAGAHWRNSGAHVLEAAAAVTDQGVNGQPSRGALVTREAIADGPALAIQWDTDGVGHAALLGVAIPPAR